MDNATKRLLLTPFNLLYKLSPRASLQLLFLLKKRQWLNLGAPVTYNEKLQWIKLYDRNLLFVSCSDKFAVRQYVKDKGLGAILNDLYWQGFSPEEIPFDQLPDQFVLKVTHGSGFNILCTSKANLDQDQARRQLGRWLREKYLPCYGEWFYGIEAPRIVAERYLGGDGDRGLVDYKFYCFGGEVRMVSADYGRGTGAHFKDIYTPEWTLRKDVRMAYPSSGTAMEAPASLGDMLRYARILSKDFLHARVDFYEAGGKPVFGELTFTNGSGFNPIQPHSFDVEMGSWLRLPIEEGD